MPNQFTQSAVSHLDCPNISCVYQMTHTPSGKFYVGSTKKLRIRVSGHFHEMRNPRRNKSPEMRALYEEHGPTAWAVTVLEECPPDIAVLKAREQFYIDTLRPLLNLSTSSVAAIPKGAKLSDSMRQQRAENAKKVWERPGYREKHKASMAGKCLGPVGYKCTPEQVENRRRAARISNMKRNYGAAWRVEYATRYPEYIGDLDA